MGIASDIGFYINKIWPWELTDTLGITDPPIKAAAPPPQPAPENTTIKTIEQLYETATQKVGSTGVFLVALAVGAAAGYFIIRRK